MRSLFTLLACSLFLNTGIASAQGLLPELKALRGEYPTPMSKAQIGELLTRTAQSKPGWVLLVKPQGNNCPAMGVKVSCDIIVEQVTGIGYDVLFDSDDAATPSWNQKGGVFTADRHVVVGATTPPPTPTDPIIVPSLPDSLNEIVDRLKRIEAALDAAQWSLKTLESRQLVFPNYRFYLFGMGITSRPE